MSHRLPPRALLIGIVALVTLVAFLTGLLAVARSVIGLLLVLALPGYTLVQAMFPRRSLGGPETLLFSIGLSLAVTVLSGLALNWTPWGLGAEPLVLALITLGAAALALRQRGWPVALPAAPRLPSGRPTLLVAALATSAMLALAGAAGVAIAGATWQPHAGFTQLWILPTTARGHSAARFGIANDEGTTMGYRLQVTARGRIVGSWPAFTVRSGATWQATVALPPGLAGAERIEATLYRANHPAAVYRRAWFWRNR